MEFSFGDQKWLPEDQLSSGKSLGIDGYALGLHAPGQFAKVLHVDKCLLQSEAANEVLVFIAFLCC